MELPQIMELVFQLGLIVGLGCLVAILLLLIVCLVGFARELWR